MKQHWFFKGIAGLALLASLTACDDKTVKTADRIVNAEAEPQNWLSYGRTYSEQRFSPLKQINDGNVNELGLAWYHDLDTARGQEATPLVVDGVIYVTTAWSKAKAFDGKTGAVLWEYDPEVPPEWAVRVCCDVVNRGTAYWQGRIYFGTLDGRLIALDAKTGELVWEKQTTDKTQSYSITGAPRVVKGKVIIGNSGAEYGVRGYVSAYDAMSGEMAWRFYTVPGNPADGFENDAMKMAAETWNGEWWKLGGGGTVWDGMAFDPELDLLYLGVGNGSPWEQSVRSPGGGDNLFLSSIVAVRPDTGEYVWHFQTTPGDNWDYTATQQITLADLEIDGKVRKVLMQAPKNGFFYVLDRQTGDFISAGPIVPLTWATGLDENGRPIENPEARYKETGKPWVAMPGPMGAHSWNPMSYSPETGLVYIPTNEAGFVYVSDPDYKPLPKGMNLGVDMSAADLPDDPAIKQAVKDGLRGHLSAWDPVTQTEVWRAQYPGPGNGGTLATAGNLVFQGTAGANFVAYRADDGEELWSMPAQTGVVAGPVSYEIDSEQYVAVMAGWGGVFALAVGELSQKSGVVPNVSRLLVFRLGGQVELPPLPEAEERELDPPALTADAATVQKGKYLFGQFCSACHGGAAHSGGVLPDLRYSDALHDDLWYDIVLDGVLKENGMVSFADVLDKEKADIIRAFVIERAHVLKAEKAARKDATTTP
ncbi:PQQ-dependent dehydrogenase, methanol/ethanol family [Emcibacter sp.]|uniref:PQQ-dependent dehydrogenase, methanol/ethanol family n=1 Tax=Emcibacter sp. TaxID=1979954 RepID=UPI002AA75416|nr:PQQ-dependent dehydrogenase, methanol/ethanol family [Emcibacter sp.]